MNHFFLYLDQSTWLHRLDARTKTLGVLGIFVIALLFSDPRYLIPPAVLIVLAIVSAGALINIKRLWLLLVLLFFYCVLLWPLFVLGRTPLFSLRAHPVTLEAVVYGIGMGIRLDVMLLAGLLLLSTTTIEEFALALQRFGVPQPIGFALSLAFRWVPSLMGAAGQIVLAQRARGLDLGAGSRLARIPRYAPLIVPLIGQTLRQTRLLAMALESKGVGPEARPSPYLESRMHLPDFLLLAILLSATGFCLWLRLHGYGTVDVQF